MTGRNTGDYNELTNVIVAIGVGFVSIFIWVVVCIVRFAVGAHFRQSSSPILPCLDIAFGLCLVAAVVLWRMGLGQVALVIAGIAVGVYLLALLVHGLVIDQLDSAPPSEPDIFRDFRNWWH